MKIRGVLMEEIKEAEKHITQQQKFIPESPNYYFVPMQKPNPIY